MTAAPPEPVARLRGVGLRYKTTTALDGITLDLPAGRFHLVLASTPASHALQIDLRTTVPQDEWPMDMATSPVRVTLEQGGAAFVVQPGRAGEGLGWSYSFHKLLAAPSQPLDVVARRTVGLAELPWLAMLGWCVFTAALWGGGLAWWRQRIARQRAEELLRRDVLGVCPEHEHGQLVLASLIMMREGAGWREILERLRAVSDDEEIRRAAIESLEAVDA